MGYRVMQIGYDHQTYMVSHRCVDRSTPTGLNKIVSEGLVSEATRMIKTHLEDAMAVPL